jgi:SsrA-binding protein
MIIIVTSKIGGKVFLESANLPGTVCCGTFGNLPNKSLKGILIRSIFAGVVDEEKIKIVATNRKAWHNYEILEKYEAGIELAGSEVKSVRAAKISFKDAFAALKGGEVILHNMHIAPYDKASHFSHEPERDRRLLLHRKEIRKLRGKIEERGLTLVPLRVYFRGAYAKVELALARGKRKYDKREAIARRESERDIRRAYKQK